MNVFLAVQDVLTVLNMLLTLPKYVLKNVVDSFTVITLASQWSLSVIRFKIIIQDTLCNFQN